ncbi:MAG: hypothetical protein HQL41_08515 [Alphaproteobacteria bacterium]|nr:hypothetical protein [Alphaproteobacteria bacterium]
MSGAHLDQPRRAVARRSAYFLETRAQVQEGVADIEAGNVVGEEEAFAEIQRLIASKSIG